MKKISWIETKQACFYKGIRIQADTGLHDQLTDIVRRVLPKGLSVLDYGSGEGALSQRISDLGYDVHSVDINQAAFKAATSFELIDFNDDAEVERYVQNNLNRYDLVLSVEIIEHVHDPWKYVRNLQRLTKPGGCILITTPNVTSWFSRIKFLLEGRFHQFEDNDRHYGHINPVTEDELRLICEKSGLVVEKILPGGWLPRLWLSKYPVTLIRNIAGFIVSFFMKGLYDGWCLIAIIKKP